jgi:hypothetical protein
LQLRGDGSEVSDKIVKALRNAIRVAFARWGVRGREAKLATHAGPAGPSEYESLLSIRRTSECAFYWLAEAEEWKQLRQSDPFKENIAYRSNDLGSGPIKSLAEVKIG